MTNNPYAPPSAELSEQEKEQKLELQILASRWQRFFGSLIDSLLLAPVIFGLVYFGGAFDGSVEEFNSATNIAFMTLASAVIFLAMHGYLLARKGQTIGKTLLGMRIVSVANREILPFGKLIGLRYLPFWLVNSIPLIGRLASLVNALFIFGDEKRCLHDYVAGTKVIKTR